MSNLKKSETIETSFDLKKLTKYIQQVTRSLFGTFGSENEDKALVVALTEEGSQEKINTYATQQDRPLLSVSCISQNGSSENETRFEVHLEVAFEKKTQNTIFFVKKDLVLDENRSYSKQIDVLNVGSGSPFEVIHSLLHNSLRPYFNSFAREEQKKMSLTRGKEQKKKNKQKKSERSSSFNLLNRRRMRNLTGRNYELQSDTLGIPVVKKKLAELELALLQCQQNVNIPEVTLKIEKEIMECVNLAKKEARKSKLTDLDDLINDQDFLNRIKNGVNKWIHDIQKVTRMKRDLLSGTAVQEINFWGTLERVLQEIVNQVQTEAVQLTLNLLKIKRRHIAGLAFETDTGLKQALQKSKNYNLLVRNFPINELLSAQDLIKIQSAIILCFSHLRKIKHTSYPLDRALKFVELISKDVVSQLLVLLSAKNLILISYEAFDSISKKAVEAIVTWRDNLSEFIDTVRGLTRRRKGEKNFTIRVSTKIEDLEERLTKIIDFRNQHEKLEKVIQIVLIKSKKDQQKSNQKDEFVNEDEKNEMALSKKKKKKKKQNKMTALDVLHNAYDIFRSIDHLDISKEGREAWDNALEKYDEQINKVEALIINNLKERLEKVKSSNEMFKVFSKFNVLFFRPKIRVAIQQYQNQLIDRVKEDIQTLHENFKKQYHQSNTSRMTKLRDLPPVAGKIIWIKQIENQLVSYLQRVQDILGKGWGDHYNGMKLKRDGNNFKRKLNTEEIFEKWKSENDEKNQNLKLNGPIFEIVKNQNGYNLNITFKHELVTLFKEVRNLQWLGFKIDNNIRTNAQNAQSLYPSAINLKESVQNYFFICDSLETHIQPLISNYQNKVQQTIEDGFNYNWNHTKLEFYVSKLAQEVITFETKVEFLKSKYQEINEYLKELKTCKLERLAIQNILKRIQNLIKDFKTDNYSNLNQWIKELDKKIEKILIQRLMECLTIWNNEFKNYFQSLDKGDNTNEKNNDQENNQKDEDEQDEEEKEEDDNDQANGEEGIQKKIKLDLDNFNYSIKIRNRIIFLDPPIKDIRQTWISSLHKAIGIICEQTRLNFGNGDLNSKEMTNEKKKGNDKTSKSSDPWSKVSSKGDQRSQMLKGTYRSILAQLPKDLLKSAYLNIEIIVKRVEKYVSTWLQYQSLWDHEPNEISKKIQNDFLQWIELLKQVQLFKQIFEDKGEINIKKIGRIRIDFSQVQNKVRNKYDAWHQEFSGRFAELLSYKQDIFYKLINNARIELERHSLESDSTSDIISFVTQITEYKRKSRDWEKNLMIFEKGEAILEIQSYIFDENYLYFETIKGEWDVFMELLNRKVKQMEEEIPTLQSKIEDETKTLNKKIDQFLTEYEETKPLEGSIPPGHALQQLQLSETKILEFTKEFEKLSLARESLEMEAMKPINFEHFNEELMNLKQVWNELSKIWNLLENLKETPWSLVVPKKIRIGLEDQLDALRKLPTNVRQYDAYSHFSSLIKGFLKCNRTITDLKSEALKDRHWQKLQKRLNVHWRFRDLKLGDIYDADLIMNEVIFREVISIAGGEFSLEKYLEEQIRDTWNNWILELHNYQNKVKLIKGWNDIFTKLGEHLNGLTQMKSSPYFKYFKEENTAWEEKLNKIHLIFDPWQTVQTKWVYLEGVFGNSDIKHLLPQESMRFESINKEFVIVMKKVAKKPNILDVINIPGLAKILERLKEMLKKVEKALGDYLEKQRAAFPRFYFVGDPDLLEIIGNSKQIDRIQRHFKKMFSGIASLKMETDNTVIGGMISTEGETIEFPIKIEYKKYVKIDEWMSKLESQMRESLILLLEAAINEFPKILNQNEKVDIDRLIDWIDKTPDQIAILTFQIMWTMDTESTMPKRNGLKGLLNRIQEILGLFANKVLFDMKPLLRKKLEHIIIELVHQRDVFRKLIGKNIDNIQDFLWLNQMRFYWNPKNKDRNKLMVHIANASFYYGFEYLGVPSRLVITPLTDRCYLTLTQAMHLRLGGNPFGPAGTGKTETVKSLGSQLGRFVLVFNCDETFDDNAMTRIFVGLCSTGAWGCFDEFNRLDEAMLSGVSQQIQTIQLALKDGLEELQLEERKFTIDPTVGLFITMNPGYAGRSNLPDNLKQLFRSIAMIKPDRELIAQVMLYSQGFRTAEQLSDKAVPLFKLCASQLSKQTHYDFGLRALKSVLVSAGNIKREVIQSNSGEEMLDESELKVLLKSICETVIPKLIAQDIPLFHSLLKDVFPKLSPQDIEMAELREKIKIICKKRNYLPSERWISKILQFYQLQNIHHGVMLVGPSGSGKTAAWRVLHEALQDPINKKFGEFHIIDPKSISKEDLYGVLDPTTRDWTDGILTHILRKIVNNERGEKNKFHWIIFDGDVSTDWIENLNSVLDDNKLLTLPNGERISLTDNVRIMFEVENLKYATPATVSRCGMVWFSEDVVTPYMVLQNFLGSLQQESILNKNSGKNLNFENNIQQQEIKKDQIRESNEIESGLNNMLLNEKSKMEDQELMIQRKIVDIISGYFSPNGFILKALENIEKKEHIMQFTKLRLLTTFFSIFKRAILLILDENKNKKQNKNKNIEINIMNEKQLEMELEGQKSDRIMTDEFLKKYILKKLLYSVLWGFSGSTGLRDRGEFGKYLGKISKIEMPGESNYPLIDFQVSFESGEWELWKRQVTTRVIETDQVAASDLVITTIDTLRHKDVVYSWLHDHLPLILCGPAGSGKTMTLNATLKQFPDYELVGINFSSATTPAVIMRTLNQYCNYKKTPNGMMLHPKQAGKWLVVFCDEINLPAPDEYGTQRALTFIRQMVEQGGFWRISDYQWVTLEKICFIGACNPVSGSYGTYAGRIPLSHRFLRHSPVLLVDYPGEESLRQIYGTFNRAVLRLTPRLRKHSSALTESMIEFYLANQTKLTTEMQPFYIYSPRELSRWCRALVSILKPLGRSVDLNMLVRITAHEALRLFQDRIIEDENRQWTNEVLDRIFTKHFPSANKERALGRPLLFSDWMSKDYVNVERNELKEYIKRRLRTFHEEEYHVRLVLFNEAIDHILRIDRVLKQPKGHALLVGASGAGKTVLSRFVAWVNGLSVFQIKINRGYGLTEFDEDLRTVMKRAGLKGERICFIFDESNILSSAFLERMNALLASGEVPGLFDEGEGISGLLNQVRDVARQDGKLIDTDEELYQYFTKQVQNNLHVVFTMNPANADFSNRSVQSPALLNRCVLDYFGTWSDEAMYEVGFEWLKSIYLDKKEYKSPPKHLILPSITQLNGIEEINHRQALIAASVWIQSSVEKFSKKLQKSQGRMNHMTPRHYLDMIIHFNKLYKEKKQELEEQQLHLNIGLKKMQETKDRVAELRTELQEKERQLKEKQEESKIKLKQIIENRKEAVTQREEAETLQTQLEEKTIIIQEKTKQIQSELSEIQPAVEQAKKDLKRVSKKELDLLRSYVRPQDSIRETLRYVCMLLGQGDLEWGSIRKVLQKKGFLKTVISFDTKSVSNKVPTLIQKYIKEKKLTKEVISKASQACGSLFGWLTAQCKLATALLNVAPLKSTKQKLTKAAKLAEVSLNKINKKLNKLKLDIKKYKEEYSVLLTESERIKGEMGKVNEKVERSEKLLNSLADEHDRWTEQSGSFQRQMETLPGDVLISAAFITYIGFFDQRYRELIIKNWKMYLTKIQIQTEKQLSLIEFLSEPEQRLEWESNKLPVDDICTENAIILNRFERYPLVIDPSGQATEFIMNQYKDKNIQKTSFLDDNLMKKLEGALRFGTCLLIEDAEYVDLILNTVLNKEYQKTGGRKLIRLGDQEIDFSPSFQMFMTTRDPTFNFTPDLCSRVTFCNFTVTLASLQSQCLNHTLKTERPDIDEARSNVLKLQGEFKLQIRKLEKQLLQTLQRVEGSILDDNTVLNKLVELKKQANIINKKALEADKTWDEILMISNVYQPFSLATSRMYFVLEQMSIVHFLYQFSLNFFLEIFKKVVNVNNPKLETVKEDKEQRLQILSGDLYTTLFRRVAVGLLNRDHLTFALRLAQIRLQEIEKELDEDELSFLLNISRGIQTKVNLDFTKPFNLNKSQKNQLKKLLQLNAFTNLVDSMKQNGNEWQKFFKSNNAETLIPQSFEGQFEKDDTDKLFKRLLLIKALHPDRILASGSQFVEAVLGKGFLTLPALDLKVVLEQEKSKAIEPILLCAQPGHDPSVRVDELVKELGVKCTSIAIGSSESRRNAFNAVTSAARKGTWVLLKNVHLTPKWLTDLEKRITSIPSTDPRFRIFLTTEFNDKLPPTFIRISQIFVFEPPPGIQANLYHTFSMIPKERITQQPSQRSRLYFLLAWFHSIVQERIRYRPLGWSKGYEFNESDQRTSLDTIDYWIDKIGLNKKNIDPRNIPWEAIRKLLGDVMYGGRVDNAFDQTLLEGMLQKLFVPESFSKDFKLIDYINTETNERFVLRPPSGTDLETYLKWVEELPRTENPTWLGLPKNAELLLLSNKGRATITTLRKMQNVFEDLEVDDDDNVSAQKEEKKKSKKVKKVKDKRPMWLKTLENSTQQWLHQIPPSLKSLKKTKLSIKDPMWRCFDTEIKVGQRILKIVINDLTVIQSICNGLRKNSGYFKKMITELSLGQVPKSWKLYPIDDVAVDHWIADFSSRIKQLNVIASSQDLCRSQGIWLGGLFDPSAFITATRQSAAHAMEWSLETLQLQITIDTNEKVTNQSYYINKLLLEGAVYNNNSLRITDQISNILNNVLLKWVQRSDEKVKNTITLPVYLNSTRLELLFSLDLSIPQNLSQNVFKQLGTAIIIWDKDF
ncbi:dynein heavy chain [Anaeramoeba flamelloides]|uniref:Dynein heavy chain, cytoplasmic n=1 Tax=Anaeramoeba flamelloides TaxID=1746091 RepID=A0ABQ8X5S8_9EUKA|nr:dynein heavy chain [Anaeramoeba flamelloides]